MDDLYNTRMNTDPYLHLEEIEGKEALLWVETQNAICQTQLEAIPMFAALRPRIEKMLDSSEKIPIVTAQNGLLYNFWRDAKQVRGLWRRTTLESYKTSLPNWEVLLDLDALSARENKNWVWHYAVFEDSTSTRALVFLSDGGTDAHTIREFDLTSKTFVEHGFYLPQAKSNATWIDQNTLWVSTDFGEGSLNNSGYARCIKEWKRGIPLESALNIFEGAKEEVFAFVKRQKEAPHRIFIFQGLDFYTNHLMLCSDGGMSKLEKPISAVAAAFNDWLLLELREDWTTNGITYLQGSLLVSNLKTAFAGQASWTVLFEPTSHSALADYCLTKNFIVLNVLENVQNRVYALHFKDGTWQLETVNAPTNSTVYVTAYDHLTNDDIWLIVTGFLTPNTLMLGAVSSSEFEIIKTTPSYFETSHLEVQQLHAISADGTSIPYFQISSKNMVLDGANPTLLTGYGGFEVSKVPDYSAALGMAWLELGGVYVLANIRGGGEFGPRWHRAALRENRQRAFEDFIAVSEDLISRQVTSSQYLGIRGGSNGGLLMGAMFTQRPDLFAAVVCAVPLLDMQRYHTLLAGASWMAEYGDPDNPEDWAFIKKYSPYHNVFPDQTYPTILFTTSTRDDRVHPGHARKMYAKMLKQGHKVLYFENTEGGHAGAANNAQTAKKLALEYSFLWHELIKKH
jgi:prolyl oligopeptidase